MGSELALARKAAPQREEVNVNRVSVKLLSRPENVALARLITAGLAAERELTMAELDEIKVAVSEAVSNSVIHGYEGRDDGWVELSLVLGRDRLTVTVRDYGVGIRDLEQALRPNWSANGRMGLGFAFMHSFMDRVEVSSEPGLGTVVTLIKDLL